MAPDEAAGARDPSPVAGAPNATLARAGDPRPDDRRRDRQTARVESRRQQPHRVLCRAVLASRRRRGQSARRGQVPGSRLVRPSRTMSSSGRYAAAVDRFRSGAARAVHRPRHGWCPLWRRGCRPRRRPAFAAGRERTHQLRPWRRHRRVRPASQMARSGRTSSTSTRSSAGVIHTMVANISRVSRVLSWVSSHHRPR